VSDFSCVLAVDRSWGIGRNNDLPWPRLPADLKHFARVTCAAPDGKRNAVIMGRKTWLSMPEKVRPMPRRLNVVITRGRLEVPEGVELVRSLDEALERAESHLDVAGLFVVGGGEIFRQAFVHPRCGDVYLTRIDADFEADTFARLPPEFVRAEVLGEHEENGVRYSIERWVRGRGFTR
jgi:dihydrofolate reductase